MFGIRKFRIRKNEIGLLFRDKDFIAAIPTRSRPYRFLDLRNRHRVDIVDMKETVLVHPDLDDIVRSGVLKDKTHVLELRESERAFVWLDKRFYKMFGPGRHVLFNTMKDVRVQTVDMDETVLVSTSKDELIRSGVLEGQTEILDLKDNQRALVWVDNRFCCVLKEGRHVLWTTMKDVRVNIVETDAVRFEHKDLAAILRTASGRFALAELEVSKEHVGVFFRDGRFVETLPPGQYACWKEAGLYALVQVPMAGQSMDITGQDIMTADKVTLRMNAVVNWKVENPEKYVRACEDSQQSMYREVQLALRAIVGARELDTFLADKDVLANELSGMIRDRAASLGITIDSVGIRDIILPGEMKNLLNKVTEAKKAAEANLIVRREETAAVRSQANTARLLENNPALMRMKELEVLEKIASAGNLNVVLGEKTLTDKIMNLI